MTCRHNPGDQTCTTQFPGGYKQPVSAPTPPTPDKANYEIMDVHETPKCLVLKVQYPNCSVCSYEGTKVMVFLGVTAIDALKWKRIDPHFSDPKLKGLTTDAPAPVARFPGSESGWNHAKAWAASIPAFPTSIPG